MSMTVSQQRQKTHPHKLLMYVAMGSIFMMFAGWISAFLVREGQGRWAHLELPTAFYVSTVLILASSFTMHMAIKAFKSKELARFKSLFILTMLLGAGFIVLQVFGFYQMYDSMGISWSDNNAAGEFTYAIPALHGVHVLGGVIAMLVYYLVLRFRRTRQSYSTTGAEIIAIYWHFVDALWIFIFLFLLFFQS